MTGTRLWSRGWSDELMFAQFPHPGVEHQPTGPQMEWNRRDHRRKFLLGTGNYILDGRLISGDFTFWGEWEPQSNVVETFDPDGRGLPRWLHDPFWEVPRHRKLLQNTDPLVFGDQFIYSNCRQARNQKLRRLAPGSIVLFGSKLHGAFVIDTVFVVGDSSEVFTSSTTDALEVDDWVRHVVLEPLSESTKAEAHEFRLYRGASFDEAPSGPYSFVPCLPYTLGDPTFRRPTSRLSDRWIKPNLAMGAKATSASASELHELWHEIVGQVARSGLALGVRIDVPPQRSPDGVSRGSSAHDRASAP